MKDPAFMRGRPVKARLRGSETSLRGSGLRPDPARFLVEVGFPGIEDDLGLSFPGDGPTREGYVLGRMEGRPLILDPMDGHRWMPGVDREGPARCVNLDVLAFIQGLSDYQTWVSAPLRRLRDRVRKLRADLEGIARHALGRSETLWSVVLEPMGTGLL